VSQAAGFDKREAFLVVSDKELAEKLSREMPEDIRHFAQVLHFPSSENIADLLRKHGEFEAAVKALCARPGEADKIEAVGAVLLSAWTESGAVAGQLTPVSVLVRKAKGINPSYIRAIEFCPGIREDAAQILRQIPDFGYSLEKGFFSWNYGGGIDHGILTYDCADPRFERFHIYIVELEPS
jgi:hypothetical protein